MSTNEIRFTTACGHEAVVKPVKKVDGKFEGKWMCRIKGPSIKNQTGVKTTFSDPDQGSAQERIARFLGIRTFQVVLKDEAAPATPGTTVEEEESLSTPETQEEAEAPAARLSLLITQPDHINRECSPALAAKKRNESTPLPKKRGKAKAAKQDENEPPSSTQSKDEKKPPAKKRRAASKPDGIVLVRTNLREAIRSMRNKYAKEKQVPPYSIFDNTALDDIVTKLPTTESELLTVRGFGPHKAKEYGPLVFDVIRNELQHFLVPQAAVSLARSESDSELIETAEGCSSRYFQR